MRATAVDHRAGRAEEDEMLHRLLGAVASDGPPTTASATDAVIERIWSFLRSDQSVETPSPRRP